MNVSECGFYFIATGQRFLEEATLSASRIRDLMPGHGIAIATDLTPPEGLFDQVILIENPQYSFADKVGPLLRSPFEKTVFLDTDTWLCEPVDELFSALDRWDIAMAHAPMRRTAASDTPCFFPEFNSGVIAYRCNEAIKSTLLLWEKLYRERHQATGVHDDQPSLRDAVWKSGASILILPPEYNFRFIMPSFAGRGGVKILHGRNSDYAGLAARINRSGSPRVFLPRLREANGRSFEILSLPGRVLCSWIRADAFCAGLIGRLIDGLRQRLWSKR